MRNECLDRELANLERECAVSKWDGYSSSPLSKRSLVFARKLAEALPEDARVPTPLVDRRGNVLFQWGSIRRRYLALTFVAGESEAGVKCKIGNAGVFRTCELGCDLERVVTFAKEHL